MRQRLAVLFILAVGFGSALTVATPALAFDSNWGCTIAANTWCVDGGGHHSWTDVEAFAARSGVPATVSQLCAYGVTDAGNVRTGSTCGVNQSHHQSCWSNGSPLSNGYVLWNYSGSAVNLSGYATTAVSCF